MFSLKKRTGIMPKITISQYILVQYIAQQSSCRDIRSDTALSSLCTSDFKSRGVQLTPWRIICSPCCHVCHE